MCLFSSSLLCIQIYQSSSVSSFYLVLNFLDILKNKTLTM